METSNRQGITAALGAYVLWGLLPVYFKLLQQTSAFEILAHRVVWSVVFMVIVLCIAKEFRATLAFFKDLHNLKWVVASAMLIAVNWLIFIWAVNDGRILETSLGYYINPIINMFMAMLFLGERMRPIQWVAFALAILGVSVQVIEVGYLPWVALCLAFSFGGYGLIKKKRPIEARKGLFVETIVLAPVAIAYLAWLSSTGEMSFSNNVQDSWLLPLTGILTAVPLLLYTAAANRISFTTLSFFQYLAPSMTFILAVTVYDEHLGMPQLISFACIWIGLILYTSDSLRRRRK